MKRAFSGIGSAIGFFGIFLYVQLSVATTYFSVWAIVTSLDAISLGQTPTTEMLLSQMGNHLLIAVLLSNILTPLVFWLIYYIQGKSFVRDAQLRPLRPLTVLPVIVLGISLNILLSVVLPFIPIPQNWMQTYMDNTNWLIGGNPILSWLSIAVLAPLTEEITFRGLIYTRLKNSTNRLIAVVLTSLAFGLAHGNLVQGLYTFFVSLVFIWVLERTGSLVSSILIHMAFNATSLILPAEMDDALMWGLLAAAIVAAAGAAWWLWHLTKPTPAPAEPT